MRRISCTFGIVVCGTLVAAHSSLAPRAGSTGVLTPACPRPDERAFLDCMLRSGRSTTDPKRSAPVFTHAYVTRVKNPLVALLTSGAQLKLTVGQEDSISYLNRDFLRNLDSTWSPIAAELAGLPERYDLDSAMAHVRLGQRASTDHLRKSGPAAFALLTTAQRKLVPPAVRVYLDPACVSQFNPYAGDAPPSC